jgi:hypothetical protein
MGNDKPIEWIIGPDISSNSYFILTTTVAASGKIASTILRVKIRSWGSFHSSSTSSLVSPVEISLGCHYSGNLAVIRRASSSTNLLQLLSTEANLYRSTAVDP